jgi:hypothetical protein
VFGSAHLYSNFDSEFVMGRIKIRVSVTKPIKKNCIFQLKKNGEGVVKMACFKHGTGTKTDMKTSGTE